MRLYIGQRIKGTNVWFDRAENEKGTSYVAFKKPQAFLFMHVCVREWEEREERESMAEWTMANLAWELCAVWENKNTPCVCVCVCAVSVCQRDSPLSVVAGVPRPWSFAPVTPGGASPLRPRGLLQEAGLRRRGAERRRARWPRATVFTERKWSKDTWKVPPERQVEETKSSAGVWCNKKGISG